MTKLKTFLENLRKHPMFHTCKLKDLNKPHENIENLSLHTCTICNRLQYKIGDSK